MTELGTRRMGALTERSLIDAVVDERARGRAPSLLVVGSRELERTALEILRDESPLGALRSSSPAVRLDEGMPAGAWELWEAVRRD